MEEELRVKPPQTRRETTKSPKRKSFFRRYFVFILLLLVILLALTSGYFYKKSRGITSMNQKEVQNLVENVSAIAVVPTDETPTIATVSDPEVLKNQSFFLGAKKGDKVLIYSVAKKAVLYDPVAHKIINIAPLNIDTEKASTTQKPINQ